MSNLLRTSSSKYHSPKINVSKRWFSKINRWIILCLVLGAFWVAGKREAKEAKESAASVLFRESLQMIQQNILYSQSVMLGVLTESYPVFPYRKEELPMESRLPFSLEDYMLSPSGELWENFLLENQLSNETISNNEKLETQQFFTPALNKAIEYKWEEYRTLENLVKTFYTVDSTTSVDENLLNIETLRSIDCSITKGEEGPDILIYHTHSQEVFADSIPGEEADTIVGAGNILASFLEQYGYKVLHHKGQYDVEKRDYAYSNALPALETILKENPSIQVVIDLHRDAVGEDTKLLTDIQGRQAAKVMFFNGIGRTREQGEISYLKNPYLKENLAFSFQMKTTCDQYYPGFARNIYLKAYRYNMHLCPKTLLIELGAQTNTVEEIQNALYPLAHVLDLVLSGNEHS